MNSQNEARDQESIQLLPLLDTDFERRDFDRDQSTKSIDGDCSASETMFNLTNYSIGLVTLALPYAIKEGGLAIIIAISFTNFVSFINAELINKMMDKQYYPNVSTFSELAFATLGKHGKNISFIVMSVELYFYIIYDYVFLGELLYNLNFFGETVDIGIVAISGKKFCIFVMWCLVIPTYFARNLKILSKISAAGMIAIIFAFIIVYIEGIKSIVGSTNTSSSDDTIVFYTNSIQYGYSIGIVLACYSLHPVLPNLHRSFKNSSLNNEQHVHLNTNKNTNTNKNQNKNKAFSLLVMICWLLLLFFQLSVSTTAYFTYGSNCQELIISNFSGVYLYIATILLIIKGITLPALLMYALLANKDNNAISQMSKCFQYLIRIILTVVALVIAILLPDFAFGASLIGFISALPMAFLFPPLMYIGHIYNQTILNHVIIVKFDKNWLQCCLCTFLCVSMTCVAFWNLISLIIFYDAS